MRPSAVGALPLLESEAKERQKKSGGAVPQKIAEAEKGEAREKAAALTGANKQYVSDAKKIAEESPETFEKVKSGKYGI